jgi:hypothetical protein
MFRTAQEVVNVALGIGKAFHHANSQKHPMRIPSTPFSRRTDKLIHRESDSMTEHTGRTPLRIETPCPKAWDDLLGDERKRFCSQCQLHVHNSAELTSSEADELVKTASGRVCMRIVTDEGGTPVFKSARPRTDSLRRIARWSLAAGASLLAACRGEAPVPPSGNPVGGPPGGTPQATLGDVCPADPKGDPGGILAGDSAEDPRVLLGEVACEPESQPDDVQR